MSDCAGIPYGILPPLLILSIEWKEFHNESVYLGERQHLTLRVLDRHRDQRDQAGVGGEGESSRHYRF